MISLKLFAFFYTMALIFGYCTSLPTLSNKDLDEFAASTQQLPESGELNNDMVATIAYLQKLVNRGRAYPLTFPKLAALLGDQAQMESMALASSNGPASHQKRQIRYHQCYFNPISCFRRRR